MPSIHTRCCAQFASRACVIWQSRCQNQGPNGQDLQCKWCTDRCQEMHHTVNCPARHKCAPTVRTQAAKPLSQIRSKEGSVQIFFILLYLPTCRSHEKSRWATVPPALCRTAARKDVLLSSRQIWSRAWMLFSIGCLAGTKSVFSPAFNPCACGGWLQSPAGRQRTGPVNQAREHCCLAGCPSQPRCCPLQRPLMW